MINIAKKTKIYLKKLGFFVALLLLTSTTTVFASESKKMEPLKVVHLMQFNEASTSSNLFFWDQKYREKLQSKVDAVTTAKKNTVSERIIAGALGIVLEFTSNDSFNKLEVN